MLRSARSAAAALGLLAALPVAALAQPYALAPRTAAGDPAIGIKVLSSRPDLVTGGDALLAVDLPRTGPVQARLNGEPLAATFTPAGEVPGRRMAVVSGLRTGDNLLEVRQGRASARLTLTNWPLQGPVISGPHEQPFICMTDSFKLPVTGEMLGPPLNAECEARERVDYVYRDAKGEMRPLKNPRVRPDDVGAVVDKAGVVHPFIVRVETGVVNRGIYQIAMLHDPATPTPSALRRSPSWNRGLIYTFGGGCPGGMYIQGRTTGGVLDEEMLARGYAVASSSLNVYGNNCHDLLAAETMMMVKERFIERYGPPAKTIGWGCSGGSYQALQIGDNYPGLLDGIVVGCSFPDVGHAPSACIRSGPGWSTTISGTRRRSPGPRRRSWRWPARLTSSPCRPRAPAATGSIRWGSATTPSRRTFSTTRSPTPGARAVRSTTMGPSASGGIR